jgi:hypothetical protein
MTTYEKGYAGTNGHRPDVDEEELARQWIADVRQGKTDPPPICRWHGALKASLHAYQISGPEMKSALAAFEATLSSYAQNSKLYPGLAKLLRPRQQKKRQNLTPMQGVKRMNLYRFPRFLSPPSCQRT